MDIVHKIHTSLWKSVVVEIRFIWGISSISSECLTNATREVRLIMCPSYSSGVDCIKQTLCILRARVTIYVYV